MALDVDAVLRKHRPQYREASEALERLAEITLPPGPTSEDTPLAAVDQWLGDELAGGVTPSAEEIIERAVRAVVEVTAREAAFGAVTYRRRQLEAVREGERAQAGDLLLKELGYELAEIVQEAAKLQPFGQIATAGPAIDHDRGNDYKRLRSLGSQYRAVRQQQVKYLAQGMGGKPRRIRWRRCWRIPSE